MKHIMSQIFSFIKKIRHKVLDVIKNHKRIVIAIFIILIIFILSLILFFDSYIRLFYSIYNFGANLLYSYGLIDEPGSIFSNIGQSTSITVPTNIQSFIYYFKVWSMSLINYDTLMNWLVNFMTVILNLLQIILYLPILIAVYFIAKAVVLKEHRETVIGESNNLKRYKNLTNKLTPLRNKIYGFISYFNSKKEYIIPLIVILLISYRIIPIGMDILSWYFVTLKTFDLFKVTALLLMSISTDILSLINKNIILLIIPGIFVINLIRVYFGKKSLHERQDFDADFQSKLPLFVYITGTPGIGKNAMEGSLMFDSEANLRDKAFGIIQKYALAFRGFDFPAAEEWLKIQVKDKKIVNRDQIEYKINLMKDKPGESFFDYDFIKYGKTYFNGSKDITIYDGVIYYLQAFFLYYFEGPIIYANYALKQRYKRKGYFPLYDYDFIKWKRFDNKTDHLTYPLNFDWLRLKFKMVMPTLANPNESLFDGGVMAMTESGKERLNAITSRQYKANDFEANVLNDGTNEFLKMARHMFSIDSVPFFQYFMDDQRETSTGADLKFVCESLIRIKSKSDTEICLPLYLIDYFLTMPFVNLFNKYFYKFRSVRKDETLYNHFLTNLASALFKHFDRIVNYYGYIELQFIHEFGATSEESGDISKQRYYILKLRMHSDSYRTDCHKSFFSEPKITNKQGMYDVKSFSSTLPTKSELDGLNSYMNKSLQETLKK